MHSDPQRALEELSRRGCFVAMNSGSSMARYRPDSAPFVGEASMSAGLLPDLALKTTPLVSYARAPELVTRDS
jgi:hypothetical protein